MPASPSCCPASCPEPLAKQHGAASLPLVEPPIAGTRMEGMSTVAPSMVRKVWMPWVQCEVAARECNQPGAATGRHVARKHVPTDPPRLQAAHQQHAQPPWRTVSDAIANCTEYRQCQAEWQQPAGRLRGTGMQG